MDLYYNCSYDNSPVGFCIGKIPEVNSKDLLPGIVSELSKENIDPFIRKCFESGLIRNAYGKIPSEGSNVDDYFFIKKKMLRKDNCNYYMNIAIAGLTWNEFNEFMQYKKDDTEPLLTELVWKSIYQDKNDIFGYKVYSEKISNLLKFKYGCVCDCSQAHLENIQETKCFYAKLLGASSDSTVINRVFGEPLVMTRVNGNYVCFQKKTGAE